MHIFLRIYEFSFPLRSNTMKRLIKHSSLWLCKWFSSSPVFIFSQKVSWLGIGILRFSFPFLVWPVREIIKMISNSYGVPLQKSNINHLIFLYTLENKKEITKKNNKSLYAYFLWTGGGATTKQSNKPWCSMFTLPIEVKRDIKYVSYKMEFIHA